MDSNQTITFNKEGNFILNGKIYTPEILSSLILNGSFLNMLQNGAALEFRKDEQNSISDINVNFNTKLITNFSHNRIIFGAPGTGKSFILNNEKNVLLKNGGEYERVTFHPDFSYAHFVGCYKPTMLEQTNFIPSLKDVDDISCVTQEYFEKIVKEYSGNSEENIKIFLTLLGLKFPEKFNEQIFTSLIDSKNTKLNFDNDIKHILELTNYIDQKIGSEITYEYIPGPFMRLYVKALKNAQTSKPEPHLLLIEEINRANVASVFGDVFQLLDRDEENVSEYEIVATEDAKKYLHKELGGKISDYAKIRIPNNMFIWATMNSADQGVFPMDTAFKRRWDFTYIGINESDQKIANYKFEIGKGKYKRHIYWNDLRKAINSELTTYKLNEDKLIGPFFLSTNILEQSSQGDSSQFIDCFKTKILMYLFDDAAKHKRSTLFYGENGTIDSSKFSEIMNQFDEKGVFIFGPNIHDKFTAEME